MSFDNAIQALSMDALRFVKDGQVLGLGSGRAATVFVKSLARYTNSKKIAIKGVPTSLQIKLVAEDKIPLIDIEHVKKIDVMFDGADQIDSQKNLIKGGGGALLKENILINIAKKVVIMADSSKFVKNFNRAVPVEVYPLARMTAIRTIEKLDGIPQLRLGTKDYPFITENGNVILDCDFGTIKNPKSLRQKIIEIAGVVEVGIFTRKPNVVYKAKANGKFDILK